MVTWTNPIMLTSSTLSLIGPCDCGSWAASLKQPVRAVILHMPIGACTDILPPVNEGQCKNIGSTGDCRSFATAKAEVQTSN